MTDILVDKNGRFSVVNGDLVLVKGRHAVAQRLRYRLRLHLGEWYLDTSAGIPYLRDILGQQPAPLLLATLIRREVEADPEVAAVVGDIQTDFDARTRTISCAFRYRTVEGTEAFADTVTL